MKKMFLLPLTVGLLLVSCKKENVAPQQQVVQQSADGKPPKPIIDVPTKAWHNYPNWIIGPFGGTYKTFTVVSGKTVTVSLVHGGATNSAVHLTPQWPNEFPDGTLSVGPGQVATVSFTAQSNTLGLQVTKPLTETVGVTVTYQY